MGRLRHLPFDIDRLVKKHTALRRGHLGEMDREFRNAPAVQSRSLDVRKIGVPEGPP